MSRQTQPATRIRCTRPVEPQHRRPGRGIASTVVRRPHSSSRHTKRLQRRRPAQRQRPRLPRRVRRPEERPTLPFAPGVRRPQHRVVSVLPIRARPAHLDAPGSYAPIRRIPALHVLTPVTYPVPRQAPSTPSSCKASASARPEPLPSAPHRPRHVRPQHRPVPHRRRNVRLYPHSYFCRHLILARILPVRNWLRLRPASDRPRPLRFYSRSRSRSAKLLNLPCNCLRQLAKLNRLRRLEPRQIIQQNATSSSRRHRCPRFQHHKRLRHSPPRIRHTHHRHLQHRRMTCQHSTSIVEMFSPPEMITSFARSRSSTYPSGCTTPRSPVWNHPLLNASSRRFLISQYPRHHRIPADHHLPIDRPSATEDPYRRSTTRAPSPTCAPLPRLDPRLLRCRQLIPLGPPAAHGSARTPPSAHTDVSPAPQLILCEIVVGDGGRTARCQLITGALLFASRVPQAEASSFASPISTAGAAQSASPAPVRSDPTLPADRPASAPCAPPAAVTPHVRHHPLQWNMGSVHKYTLRSQSQLKRHPSAFRYASPMRTPPFGVPASRSLCS